jgi:hypothetical protein
VTLTQATFAKTLVKTHLRLQSAIQLPPQSPYVIGAGLPLTRQAIAIKARWKRILEERIIPERSPRANDAPRSV